MTENISESLQKFRDLIKKDFKQISSKQKKEQMNLNYWFVTNCPARKGPKTAQKFVDYGYKPGHDFSILKKQILNSVDVKEDSTYKYFLSGSDMESQIDEIEKIYKSSEKKQIIFFAIDGDGGSEIDSLFIRIRNSIAHVNYFKKNGFYYLWNETSRGKLGSFMVLKYKDLENIYNSLQYKKTLSKK